MIAYSEEFRNLSEDVCLVDPQFTLPATVPQTLSDNAMDTLLQISGNLNGTKSDNNSPVHVYEQQNIWCVQHYAIST